MICAINPRTAPAEITLRSAASADRAVSIAIVISIEAKIRIIGPSRVTGFARQHAEIDADLLQCPLVFRLGILAEDEVKIGGAVQPAVLMDLVFELAGRPSCITERKEGVARSFAASDRLENVEGSGEADALVDRQRGILDEEVARVQHEAAAGLDRAALEDLDPVGRRG